MQSTQHITIIFDFFKRVSTTLCKILNQVEADDLVKYGLIPELIGRLHMLATLNQISEDDMVHILTEPKNALIKQYIKLFEMDDVPRPSEYSIHFDLCC